MKIAVLSDPHFHSYKTHSKINEAGQNSRLMDIADAFGQAVDQALQKGCKALLIPGDMFHIRGATKPSVFNVAWDCVQYAALAIGRVLIIPGNHDMESYSGGDTSIDKFNEIEGVHVLKNAAGCIEGLYVLGIQYCHSLEYFEKTVDAVYSSPADIVMIHQGIDTFKPSSTIPDTGITVELINRLFGGAQVFAGHYHNHKIMGNVVQVGALVQHTFGDEGQERGFCVYDTATKETEFCPVNSPKFVTVEEVNFTLPEKGDIVRVNIKEKAKLKKVLKSLDGFAGDVVVISQKEIEHKAPEVIIKAGAVKEMLQKYAAHKFPEKAAGVISLYDQVCLGLVVTE